MKFQLFYLAYRYTLSLFFIVSIFFTGFDPLSGEEKYFIFLTNWIFFAWTLYCIWASVSVTITFIQVFACKKEVGYEDIEGGGPCNHELLIDERPAGCCGIAGNKIYWHQRILWVLHAAAVHTSIYVVILFWGLLYDPDADFNYWSFVNLVTHLVTGVLAIIEIYLTAVPSRLLHFIYPFIFAGTYIVFSGIYYAGGGTNVSGRRYIYSVLDYMNSPGSAAALGLVALFATIPLHVLIYFLFLSRELILFLVGKHCSCYKPAQSRTDDEELELN